MTPLVTDAPSARQLTDRTRDAVLPCPLVQSFFCGTTNKIIAPVRKWEFHASKSARCGARQPVHSGCQPRTRDTLVLFSRLRAAQLMCAVLHLDSPLVLCVAATFISLSSAWDLTVSLASLQTRAGTAPDRQPSPASDLTVGKQPCACPTPRGLFFKSKTSDNQHTISHLRNTQQRHSGADHPSPRGGGRSLTWAPPPTLRPRRDAANARAALHAKLAAQRSLHACSTLCWTMSGSQRAFARARKRKSILDSFGQSAANFPSKDHEATPRSGTDQLRIGAFLLWSGLSQGRPVCVGGTRSGIAPTEWCPPLVVQPPNKRKAVGQGFPTSTLSCLSTHSSSGTLNAAKLLLPNNPALELAVTNKREAEPLKNTRVRNKWGSTLNSGPVGAPCNSSLAPAPA